MLVNCHKCNKQFNKAPSQIKKTLLNFCSRSCANSYHNHIKPKRIKKIRTCKVCGKVISNTKTLCKEHNYQIVDWDKETINTILNKPKKIKKIYTCLICGKPLDGRKTKCEEHNLNLVNWDKKTLDELRSIRKYQLSSRIRDLARNIYLKSGRPQECMICKYKKHFHVCHIKPIKTFDLDASISEINSIDNLIALCPNHHWELDNGLLIIRPTGIEPV